MNISLSARKRLNKVVGYLLATSFVLSCIFSLFPDATLSAWTGLAFFTAMRDLIPAIPRISQSAAFPALTTIVLGLNWIFVPFVFMALTASNPFWRIEVQDEFKQRITKKAGTGFSWSAFLGWLILLFTVLSDFFDWRYFSAFNGRGIADFIGNHLTWQARLLSQSPLLSSITYWVVCLIPAFAYYSTPLGFFIGVRSLKRWVRETGA